MAGVGPSPRMLHSDFRSSSNISSAPVFVPSQRLLRSSTFRNEATTRSRCATLRPSLANNRTRPTCSSQVGPFPISQLTAQYDRRHRKCFVLESQPGTDGGILCLQLRKLLWILYPHDSDAPSTLRIRDRTENDCYAPVADPKGGWGVGVVRVKDPE